MGSGASTRRDLGVGGTKKERKKKVREAGKKTETIEEEERQNGERLVPEYPRNHYQEDRPCSPGASSGCAKAREEWGSEEHMSVFSRHGLKGRNEGARK